MMRSLSSLLILILILQVACRGQLDYPTVQLGVADEDAVVAAERAPGKLPLRVAVAAVISPKATFDTYNPLLDYLAQQLDRPVELLQRPTYAEINELLRTGQADVGFVCGGAFVEGEREGYLKLLVAPEIGGLTTYQALIIVPTDSSARSFDDLRGRRFAFTDPLSNSGRLYTQYRLAQMDETPESYFGETIYTYSHDNSVRAVAEGIVEGATVDSLVFDVLVRSEPELANQLRVIEHSPQFGIPPVVTHPNLDSDLKEALRLALLSMHQDPQGQKALAMLYVDRFVPADTDSYEEIRNMAATIRAWP